MSKKSKNLIAGRIVKTVIRQKNLIFLLLLFFLAEYARVVLDFLIEKSADNLIFCLIIMVWNIQIRRRIIEDRPRKFFTGLAMSLFFLYVIRTAKYILFDKNTILWYMYYIPLTVIPVLSFFLSKYREWKKNYLWCIAGLIPLNLMILTNDWHQMVFHFRNSWDINDYSYYPGYVITILWIAFFSIASMYNLYRSCSLPQVRNRIWVPLIPFFMDVILLVISVAGKIPVINNTIIWSFMDVVLFMIIAIVEALVQTGILPSNEGYEEIFANSGVNACITDGDNRVVYSSDREKLIDEEKRNAVGVGRVMVDDYTRLHANPINGGTVYFTEDIRGIVELNHKLEEAAEIINDENVMIEAQNRLLADEAVYKTKNKLYDDIATIVHPQVLMIEECLEKCEQDSEFFAKYMAKAAVLNAYIKRRINLSLIAMENEAFPLTELSLAMTESLIYLKYSNVATDIFNNVEEKSINAEQCIGVYDYFQSLLEAYYDQMSAVMVTFCEKQRRTEVRITLETDRGRELLQQCSFPHEIYEDEDLVSITILLSEGGDGQ